jgi:hypothetical protein
MKIHKTLKEAVAEMFFKEVLGASQKVLKQGDTLSAFCPDKKFLKEFLKMYVDRTERVFGASIKNMEEKPLLEILDFLTERKRKDSVYGNRPYKK